MTMLRPVLSCRCHCHVTGQHCGMVPCCDQAGVVRDDVMMPVDASNTEPPPAVETGEGKKEVA